MFFVLDSFWKFLPFLYFLLGGVLGMYVFKVCVLMNVSAAFRNFVTYIAAVILHFYVIFSTPSVFAASFLSALVLSMLIRQYKAHKNDNLQQWFWAVGREPEQPYLLFYYLVSGTIYVYSLVIFLLTFFSGGMRSF
ncbi:MAG: hypothetical protein ACOC6Q_00945 [Patescibacteria group bacterium]